MLLEELCHLIKVSTRCRLRHSRVCTFWASLQGKPSDQGGLGALSTMYVYLYLLAH